MKRITLVAIGLCLLLKAQAIDKEDDSVLYEQHPEH